MTILEAILSNPVFTGVSSTHIESLLISRSIDGSTNYDNDSLKELELVSADMYVSLAISPEIKEGNFKSKFNPKLLKNRARAIYAKYEDPKLDELMPQEIELKAEGQGL